MERRRGLSQYLQFAAIGAARETAGQTYSAPQINLALLWKGGDQRGNAVHQRAAGEPEAATQTLIKEANSVRGKISRDDLSFYGALPGKKALVKTIAIHNNPAEQWVQARKELFGRAMQAGQSQTHADINRVDVMSRRSLDKLLQAILPGGHDI